MAIVTKEQAREIYNHYAQIEDCEKLIESIDKRLRNEKGRLPDIIRDKDYSFSGSIKLEVPYFDNLTGDFDKSKGCTVYNLNYPNALKVLKAHIRILKRELKELQPK